MHVFEPLVRDRTLFNIAQCQIQAGVRNKIHRRMRTHAIDMFINVNCMHSKSQQGNHHHRTRQTLNYENNENVDIKKSDEYNSKYVIKMTMQIIKEHEIKRPSPVACVRVCVCVCTSNSHSTTLL